MGYHYGVLTKNGWFYGFDEQRCVGIYVQKRSNATQFSTMTKAEAAMGRYGITNYQVVNLDK